MLGLGFTIQSGNVVDWLAGLFQPARAWASAISALWRSAVPYVRWGGCWGYPWFCVLEWGYFFPPCFLFTVMTTKCTVEDFIYRDAFTYDKQAWRLVHSGLPLWKAFDRSSGIEEQYGGLTFTLGLTYRVFSPDAHRPWLTMLLSALIGTLGVGMAWKGARQAWGEGVALLMGWIMALYPELLLSGSSQIREPFLLLFIAMLFWAVVTWRGNNQRTIWIWLVAGIAGLFLFSPGIAVTALVVLGVWFWLARKDVQIRWWWVAGAVIIIALAGWLFSQIVAGALKVQGGPLTNLINWLKYAANFGASVTTLNSGWLQTIFETLPKPLHLPFIVAYGIAQPVLPAAIADPAVWPVRLIGILRGLGWYALLPFLLYSLRPIWKTEDIRKRMAWLWLWLTTWVWIILASARAGGDQWDNPRYRVILLMFQAALAGNALTWQRCTQDRWLARILAVEGVFLVVFGYWYFTRNTDLNLITFNIFVVFGSHSGDQRGNPYGGWLRDRRRLKRKKDVSHNCDAKKANKIYGDAGWPRIGSRLVGRSSLPRILHSFCQYTTFHH